MGDETNLWNGFSVGYNYNLTNSSFTGSFPNYKVEPVIRKAKLPSHESFRKEEKKKLFFELRNLKR